MQMYMIALSLILVAAVPLSCGDDVPERSDPKDLVDPLNLPYYEMANWFLEDLVQLKYLYDLEEKLGITFTRPSDLWDDIENAWEDYTVYFIGYTVCLSVGVFVMILAMPLTGCVVACCRCCGNCGGGKPKRGQKPSSCKRIGCGIALLIVTAALGFGAAGLFIANESLRERLDEDQGGKTNMFSELSISVQTMDKYAQDSIGQFNSSVLGQYMHGVDELNMALDDLPNNGFKALDEQTNVVSDMTELSEFTVSLPTTSRLMNDVDTSIIALNGTLTELEVALANVTQDILGELANCTEDNCKDAKSKLNNLTVGVNTNGIDFSSASTAVDAAINDNIIPLVNNSAMELYKIKEDIETSLKGPIDDISTYTNETQKEIIKSVEMVTDAVEQIDFDVALDAVKDAGDAVNDYYVYVYASLLTLGVIICITLLCNVIGVLAGFFCPRPYAGARSCQCDTVMGGQWLLAGLVFTFVFYWLYTVIVASMFVSGGVTHTEFCRHAVHYDDQESQKVLDIFDRLINTTLAENSGVELEVFSLYETCQTNESFYEALDIAARGYNISGMLNMSAIAEAVEKVGETTITLSPVMLMNSTIQDTLNTLETALDDVDFDTIEQQLNEPVVTEDIDEITAILKKITGLDSYIKTLDDLKENNVQPAEVLVKDILVNVTQIKDNVEPNVTALALNLEADETEINSNGSMIIEAATKDKTNDLADRISAYASAIENDVATNVGNCFPFFEAFTNVIDATCVKTLYPFNSLWYSLGWILFFFIPSIILSFFLISEYQVPVSFTDMEDADPSTYDAFTNPAIDHVLLPQNAAAADKGYVNEFDNPIYNEKSYHIPRPSLKSKEPNPDYDNNVNNIDAESTGSEFRLPRPKLYGSGSDTQESPPSYRSIDRQHYGTDTHF